MSKHIKRFIAAVIRLCRGSQAMNDLADYPLPLYMRHSAGLGPPEPPHVHICAECGVRYFERTVGSFLPENGKCRSCSTAPAASPAAVAPFRRTKTRGAR